MKRVAPLLAVAALIACDEIAGPKPPSPDNQFIEVVTSLSKLVVQPGDTMRFTYTIENITDSSLTLTTQLGCQVRPLLDQVGGRTMSPPPFGTGTFICDSFTELSNSVPTVTVLAAGEIITSSVLLRAAGSSSTTLGYILTAGHFDASVIVRADEIGEAQSDWVRFEIK